MRFWGGHHTRPWRQFAKVMVFVSTVMLVMLYDSEVLIDVQGLKLSMQSFEFGTHLLGSSCENEEAACLF
jgi:hypothetical protein